jgi:universal stress protein E
MGLNRLLTATDFSSRAERALQRAHQLSDQFSAELHILHVVDDDQPAALADQEARQAGDLLDGIVTSLPQVRQAQPTPIVRKGDPFAEIVSTAADLNADLVVMGPHRKQLLRDVFVGTTIERVMRTGQRPVLMVNTEPAGPYNRVLVAIDLSDASGNALRTARELGLLDSAFVVLLHAFEPLAKGMLIYANIERERIEEYVESEAAEAQRAISSFLASLEMSDLAYTVRLEEGSPYETIRRSVARTKPDLVVIGTRGLTGIRRVLLGSVADAVLRGVECDILAVPPH